MLKDYLGNLIEKFNHLAEKLFSGKYGWVKLALFCVFLSVFFSFPSYDVMRKGEFDHNWEAIIEQTKAPFVQKDYPPTSHESKLALRLTPPLIGKFLGINSKSGFLILQAVFLVLFFLFLTKALFKLTNDIASTAYLSISFALMFVGAVLFSDIRGISDGIAFAFLILAMCWKNSFLIFIATFLASFTDERAFLASSLVFLYWIVRENNVSTLTVNTLIRGNQYSWAVIFSALTFLGSRLLLYKIFGLFTPTGGGGIPLAIEQINAWALGLWTGLEGFWLLVIAAGIALYLNKNHSILLLTFICAGVVFFVAVTVFDITRSMAYLFPLAIFSVSIIEKVEKKIAVYLYFVTMIISALPSYYIGGKNTVMMLYPLPLRLLRIFFKE